MLNDGMQTVKGVLHVAADVDLVYSILTDYDSCARVFRNIAGTETVYTPTGGKQVVQVSPRLLAKGASCCSTSTGHLQCRLSSAAQQSGLYVHPTALGSHRLCLCIDN